MLGGGFYRPGGRGQGRPVGGRRRGFWRRARAKPGAAALGACWRGLVTATGHCASALARSRRSATCREQREKRGGPGMFFLFSSMSHGLGRGRGGWARQPGEGGSPQVWLQGRDDVGHSEIDFSGFLPTRCSTQCPQEFKIRIFEKFHFGLSTYYTRIPEIFLLSKKMRFCRNLISNLKFGH
jgi:hypothetical protein